MASQTNASEPSAIGPQERARDVAPRTSSEGNTLDRMDASPAADGGETDQRHTGADRSLRLRSQQRSAAYYTAALPQSTWQHTLEERGRLTPPLMPNGHAMALTSSGVDRSVPLPTRRVLYRLSDKNKSEQPSRPQQQRLIESVLPNLRDLSVSAHLEGVMKSGMLYRSARNFASSVSVIKQVFCDILDIVTVIDLRDDDLTAAPSEQFSRSVVAQAYGLQLSIPLQEVYSIEKLPSTTTANRSVCASESTSTAISTDPPAPTTSHASEHALEAPAAIAVGSLPARSARRSSSSRQSQYNQFLFYPKECTNAVAERRSDLKSCATKLPMGGLEPLSVKAAGEDPAMRRHSPHISSSGRPASNVAKNALALPPDVPPQPMNAKLSAALAYERQRRRLYIINVLNSPDIRARIMETVTRSYTLPLFMLYKLTDKLTGSALAPYYFCKYFISSHDVLESYLEMLKFCGTNFCKVLKVITLATPPILFHCTLGKDRTGIISLLLLSILGAPESSIIDDYTLTEQTSEAFSVFKYNFTVRVSGLPEHFTHAKPETCRGALAFLKQRWESVDGYLDSIGFTHTWREALRSKFLVQPSRDLITPDS